MLDYDDLTELREASKGFTDYLVVPEPGMNRFYSDNRDSLPSGFYDEFREKFGLKKDR